MSLQLGPSAPNLHGQWPPEMSHGLASLLSAKILGPLIFFLPYSHSLLGPSVYQTPGPLDFNLWGLNYIIKA